VTSPHLFRRIVVTSVLVLNAVAVCSWQPTPRLANAAQFESSTTTAADAVRALGGPAAEISGPVAGGQGMSLLLSPKKDLATHGYHETEWFASGTARSYAAIGSTRNDGRWKVGPLETASYRTRVLSFVPDASRFNGTVLLEWLNVTAGFDLPNDLAYLSPEIERSGYAWIGVSAQSVGVNALREDDPARYGTLSHPGDAFALDIFSQVGRAVRNGALAPLRALKPHHFLAVGQSQSAFALTTYIDAVQPTAHIFDGFFVHSRGGGALRLDGISTATSFTTGAVRLRSGVGVPVLVFETETDEQIGNYFGARQPDSHDIRLWDIAGASHEDSYLVPSAQAAGCRGNVNKAPTHYVAEAALHALDHWVRTGTPPPSAPRLSVKLIAGKPIVQRDQLGIAIGGIRTAAIDVPVVAYSGIGTDHSSTSCELIGNTQPFSATTLKRLYSSKARYVGAFTKSTDAAIAAGFILPADRSHILAGARQTYIQGR
jgi:Alpha/beta hydrolase domain